MGDKEVERTLFPASSLCLSQYNSSIQNFSNIENQAKLRTSAGRIRAAHTSQQKKNKIGPVTMKILHSNT
jgi:hypothetical protein